MIPRLRQIQIQSFKSLGRAVVDLEPFTALVGANGSGKTNFLDSLRFVKDCLTHSPREACESRGGSRIVPRWQVQAPDRTGFLLRIDLAEGLSADYAFEIGWDGAGLPRVTHELCRVQGADREQVFEVAEGQFRREIAGIRPRIQPDRLALTIAAATEEFRPVYDFLTALQFYSILPDALRFGSSLAGGSLASSGTNAAEILLRSGEAGHERIHQLLARAVPGLREVHPHEEAGGRWGLEIKQEVGAAQLASFNAAEMSLVFFEQ